MLIEAVSENYVLLIGSDIIALWLSIFQYYNFFVLLALFAHIYRGIGSSFLILLLMNVGT